MKHLYNGFSVWQDFVRSVSFCYALYCVPL